jgi:hypothetical protein
MGMRTVGVDEDLHNSDWTKQSWDLPPYKSKEFMEQVHDLEAFKITPVYLHAVKAGLIVNDNWAGAKEVTHDSARKVRAKGFDPV